MPSYFYHLKFELYPYHPSTVAATTPDTSSPETNDIWVPPPDSNIFNTKTWPAHKLVVVREVRRTVARERSSGGATANLQSADPRGRGGGAIIDCGPGRGSTARNNEDLSNTSLLVHRPQRDTDIRLPRGATTYSDLETAKGDWRFGPVRIEGLDMAPSMNTSMGAAGERRDRPGHRRGESSVGNASGINAGLETGQTVGRVTKARFEALEGKGTDVGWGVVHLYRDGEETPGLGLGGGRGSVEVYDTRRERGSNANLGGESGLQDEKTEDEKLEEDCTTLCISAVPGYFTQSDFLGFVGEKTMQEVSHFRMVMTGRMNRYMVLMKFRDGAVARRWRTEWDGKVFISMEPETCHVAFIKSITFQTPSSSSNPSSKTSYPELSHDPFIPSSTTNTTTTYLKPFPPPTPNLVELPTCPVCLERMDDTTGLLTILCQHVFHCACLQKWRGSGCPVCRHTNPSLSATLSPTSTSGPNDYVSSYDPAIPPFGSPSASLCSVCDCASDLWICLICGNVGCGRYKGGHAKEHWKDSAHNFALEIETQHVWDYAGDLWVHRLIRDKGDSKVIEVGNGGARRNVGSLGGGDEDMDMVPREKLERIGIEYTHLLTSQLESQRVYFEELVGKAVSKASSAATIASSASARADEAISRLKELEVQNKRLTEEVLPNLERDLEREKKKAERSGEVARGFGKSLMEEKKVSEGLMGRIEHVNSGMMVLSRELEQVKAYNEELKEENRDLLFSITAGEKLRNMVGTGEGDAGAGDGAGAGVGASEGDVNGREVNDGTVVRLEREELESGMISVPSPPPPPSILLTPAERRKAARGKGRGGQGGYK